MRSSWIKGLGVSISLMVLMGTLLGCSIFSSNSTPLVDGVIDTSKHIKLSMYLMGPPSAEPAWDFQGVVDELNDNIGNKMNAYVDITLIPADEADVEYPLIFNSGTGFDISYVSTAGEPGYFSLTSDEVLLDIDELLPTYGKKLWEGIGPDRWEDTRYEGKIYAVPMDGYEYRINGFILGGDIHNEYEPGPILSIGDIKDYLDALTEENGDKSVIDISEGSAMGLYNMLVDLHKTWIPVPGIPESSLYLVSSSGSREGNILHPAFSWDFVEFADMMKEWADNGFWQGDVLAADNDIAGRPNAGRDALMFGDFNRFLTIDPRLGDPSVQKEERLKFIPFWGEGKGIIKAGSAKNALGIGAGSRNPERALMLIDYIIGSEVADQLLGYGYKGKIVDYSSFWVDPDNREVISVKDPYDKFVFDDSLVKEEVESILMINSQYGIPILLGKAGDPKAAVQRYRQELEVAGIQKVIDTLKEQLKDF